MKGETPALNKPSGIALKEVRMAKPEMRSFVFEE
jgi:hypothetical protein